MVHLSRIAEDFILMTGEEFGFELADSSATAAMPQKKNPDPLELRARQRARHRASDGILITRGLPTGYNKDLQEDKGRCSTGGHARGVARRDHPAASNLTLHLAHRPRRRCLLLATDVADYPCRAACRFGRRTRWSVRWCAGG
jgi:argininosuccinate lyase